MSWYFKRGEIMVTQCLDPITTAVVASMGRNELLSVAQTSYNFADKVHAVVPVEPLEVELVSLRVLDGDTFYTRTDLTLERSTDGSAYSLVPVSDFSTTLQVLC